MVRTITTYWEEELLGLPSCIKVSFDLSNVDFNNFVDYNSLGIAYLQTRDTNELFNGEYPMWPTSELDCMISFEQDDPEGNPVAVIGECNCYKNTTKYATSILSFYFRRLLEALPLEAFTQVLA